MYVFVSGTGLRKGQPSSYSLPVADFRIYQIRSILEFVVICANGPQITPFLITYQGTIPSYLTSIKIAGVRQEWRFCL
jgi:hypothetical protein